MFISIIFTIIQILGTAYAFRMLICHHFFRNLLRNVCVQLQLIGIGKVFVVLYWPLVWVTAERLVKLFVPRDLWYLFKWWILGTEVLFLRWNHFRQELWAFWPFILHRWIWTNSLKPMIYRPSQLNIAISLTTFSISIDFNLIWYHNGLTKISILFLIVVFWTGLC